MADIANTTVFTNGSSVSCSSSDLLRRAFQEVVDDDEGGGGGDDRDEFVAFLQSDGENSSAIHLTHEQASALRLTFQVETAEEANNDATYENDEDAEIGEIARTASLENGENSSCPGAPASESLDYRNDDARVKVECTNLEGWTNGVSSSRENYESEPISIGDLGLAIADDSARPRPLRQPTNARSSKFYSPRQSTARTDGADASRFVSESSRNISKKETRDSQAQILQSLPMILPSSQFVAKPARAVAKCVKNVRILPGTSKIGNITINSGGNLNGQNSILLPKGTLLNTLSPRLINATPITTRLINNGCAVSAQLLNATQIPAGLCEFTNENVATTTTSLNGGAVRTATGVPIVPALKMSTGLIRAGDNQRFMVPANPKSNQESGGVVKTVQTANGNTVGKVGTCPSFFKSVQIPAQFLRNAATAFVKSAPGGATKISSASANSPLILKSSSLLKAQEVKGVATCASSILRPTTQTSTNPMSILKPQTKIISYAKSNKQSNYVTSYGNNATTSPRYVQRTTSSEGQNGATRERIGGGDEATGKIVKRARVAAGIENPVAITAEQTDTTKPLGSSENPIQIVQQGHTFHSMQRLTQSQLKQIAHVLQQRSQEAAMPNERIVYRVVFPEELDLRMRNPGSLSKGRGAKRGRPKKNAVRPSIPLAKVSTTPEEEHEDTKDDRKKVIARTRSGRLSRPPRHMVRDYKHLHHLDFMQPDMDDSDGGYSDYNTNAEKLDSEMTTSKELLSGLEVPKRKISDHFRCPTCNKIYLGRTRMARHFEMHPDHGSPEQLPPPTPDPELKRALVQDPLKRKGKKRGPWAYVTPEAKSERRQSKLKEAISVCDDLEIVNIAAKPVLKARSFYDLLVVKSDGNVRNFLNEFKELVEKIREQIGGVGGGGGGGMLSVANEIESDGNDCVNLSDEALLCDALGLDPGVYRINSEALKKPDEIYDELDASMEEPPSKLQKTENPEEPKEQSEERMSSGFSESSDLSVSDFFSDRKNDCHPSANCPEVLMALTLMPRNPSPPGCPRVAKSTNMSKLLISNPEIQNQLSENRGFRKIDINSTKPSSSSMQSYRKLENAKENGFGKLPDDLELDGCSSVFDKLNVDYEHDKQHLPNIETLEQAFIKLEPTQRGFKLDNTTVSSYTKENSRDYDKIDGEYHHHHHHHQHQHHHDLETGSQSFVKGFQKLISKISDDDDVIDVKSVRDTRLNGAEEKIIADSSIRKIRDNLPAILQDSSSMISDSCDQHIFGTADNLDIGKITGYDHIPHLDILTGSGVIDKHMIIDEKLVEQLHLVDQTNLVDELVSERLKNIMPDNILDNNLIQSAPNLDADLDFEALSEEFNRNTRS